MTTTTVTATVTATPSPGGESATSRDTGPSGDAGTRRCGDVAFEAGTDHGAVRRRGHRRGLLPGVLYRCEGSDGGTVTFRAS
jgi:hypothetical protein